MVVLAIVIFITSHEVNKKNDESLLCIENDFGLNFDFFPGLSIHALTRENVHSA